MKLTERQQQGLDMVPQHRLRNFGMHGGGTAELYDYEGSRIWQASVHENGYWYLTCDYMDMPAAMRQQHRAKAEAVQGLVEALDEALRAPEHRGTVAKAWAAYRHRYPRTVAAGWAAGTPLVQCLYEVLDLTMAEAGLHETGTLTGETHEFDTDD